jgi:hypothetical protein
MDEGTRLHCYGFGVSQRESTDEFPLERGLRQCDIFSPFIFLLAAEGLNVMMRAMVDENQFMGYNVGGQEAVTV